MSFEIRTRKGAGETVGYCLRRLSISTCKSLKPIGFRLDGGSNVAFSSVVVEDLITFVGHLSDYNFKYSDSSLETKETEEDRLEIISLAGKTISASDFKNNSNKVHGNSVEVELGDKGDRVLLTATQDIHLTLYLRYGSGVHTAEENTEFIHEHTNSDLNVSAISSLHNKCKYFTWEVDNSFEDYDLVKINCDRVEIVEQVLEIAQSIFTQISLS